MCSQNFAKQATQNCAHKRGKKCNRHGIKQPFNLGLRGVERCDIKHGVAAANNHAGTPANIAIHAISCKNIVQNCQTAIAGEWLEKN